MSESISLPFLGTTTLLATTRTLENISMGCFKNRDAVDLALGGYNAILVVYVVESLPTLIPVPVLGRKTDLFIMFGVWVNARGWSTRGVSFMASFMGIVYALTDAENPAHSVKEIDDAAVRISQPMVYGVCLSGAMSVGILTTMLFVLEDPIAVLTATLGFPAYQVYSNGLNHTVGTP